MTSRSCAMRRTLLGILCTRGDRSRSTTLNCDRGHDISPLHPKAHGHVKAPTSAQWPMTGCLECLKRLSFHKHHDSKRQDLPPEKVKHQIHLITSRAWGLQYHAPAGHWASGLWHWTLMHKIMGSISTVSVFSLVFGTYTCIESPWAKFVPQL